jgi:hypothetical protein
MSVGFCVLAVCAIVTVVLMGEVALSMMSMHVKEDDKELLHASLIIFGWDVMWCVICITGFLLIK